MSSTSKMSGIKDQMMGAVEGGLQKFGNWMYKERDTTSQKVGMVALRVFFWIAIAGASVAIMTAMNGGKNPLVSPADFSDPLKLMGLVPLGTALGFSVGMLFFETVRGEKNRKRARQLSKIMCVAVPVLCGIVVLGSLAHIIKGTWGINRAPSGSIWRSLIPSAVIGAAVVPMVAGTGYFLADRVFEEFRRERRTITVDEYNALRRIAEQSQERRLKQIQKNSVSKTIYG